MSPGARLGLGLAAVGRPAYITTGRGDLPGDRRAQPEAPPVKFHDARCSAGQVNRGDCVV